MMKKNYLDCILHLYFFGYLISSNSVHAAEIIATINGLRTVVKDTVR